MSDHIYSIRTLAKRVGRSPSTVHAWLQRDDFPVRRKPPWSADDVVVVRRWSNELQPDRAEHAPRPIPIPGTIAFDSLSISDYLQRFVPSVTPDLLDMLSAADLKWLAKTWTAAVSWSLVKQARKLKWEDPYRTERPDNEWRELFSTLPQKTMVQLFGAAFTNSFGELLDARFGRARWVAKLNEADRAEFAQMKEFNFGDEDPYITQARAERGDFK